MQIKKIDNSCLIQGDCIEAMQMLIEQGVKVDAVITDPPYGTSACQWDSVIPLDKMWECLNGLNAVISIGILKVVNTASQRWI